MKAEKPQGGDFKPLRAGQHLAICTRMVDLGTHTSHTRFGEKTQRKIMLAFEIPEERIEYEKDGVPVNEPALHIERFTWSFHENAILRKTLESWRGVPFKESELSGPDAFDTKALMGVPALIQIVHVQSGDKTFANMQAIMKAPIKKTEWPAPELPTIYLDLRDFDQGAFDMLSEYWQNMIRSSPEYQQLFPEYQGSAEQGYAEGKTTTKPPVEDDEIPF